MHNIRKIQEDLIYVGGNDRRLALFENIIQFQEEYPTILIWY